jgi:AraC-like DNA-binding protein
MTYREIKPGHLLKAFVKCYYIYEASSAARFDDYVFPSGSAELIFNLGDGNWQIAGGGGFVTTPLVELWGQVTIPLVVRSVGKNTMLGIRFFPHGASVFLKENLDALNNQVVDFRDVSKPVKTLYSRLQETADWSERIDLVEEFLLESIAVTERKNTKLAVVNDVMEEMKQADFFDNIDNVASRYGITSRYLQKLFLQYTGLTPKLYQKIHRFQNSLKRVTQKNASFTDIAYDCGYFDQSHFIREFKSFTGFTPSAYSAEKSPITLAFANQ